MNKLIQNYKLIEVSEELALLMMHKKNWQAKHAPADFGEFIELIAAWDAKRAEDLLALAAQTDDLPLAMRRVLVQYARKLRSRHALRLLDEPDWRTFE